MSSPDKLPKWMEGWMDEGGGNSTGEEERKEESVCVCEREKTRTVTQRQLLVYRTTRNITEISAARNTLQRCVDYILK